MKAAAETGTIVPTVRPPSSRQKALPLDVEVARLVASGEPEAPKHHKNRPKNPRRLTSLGILQMQFPDLWEKKIREAMAATAGYVQDAAKVLGVTDHRLFVILKDERFSDVERNGSSRTSGLNKLRDQNPAEWIRQVGAAMKKADGDVAAAAEALGVSRRHLYDHLKDLRMSAVAERWTGIRHVNEPKPAAAKPKARKRKKAD